MISRIVIVTILSGLSSLAFADGDAIAGKTVFKKCQTCHTIDGPNRVGPSLTGIVGRSVASVDGFKYSKAMTAFAEDGKTWNAQLLAEYLEAPRTVVKGTSMTFAGIKKPDELENLIAYLNNPTAAQ